MDSEYLLAQGKALIYIERNCTICHQYMFDLKACKESVKAKLQIISVSTPAQTKEMARTLPRELPLLLVKDQKFKKSIYATPTTKIGKGQKVGILNCDQLEKLLTSNLN